MKYTPKAIKGLEVIFAIELRRLFWSVMGFELAVWLFLDLKIHGKFRHSEKATICLKNLPLCFDFTKQFYKKWDFFYSIQKSRNPFPLQKVCRVKKPGYVTWGNPIQIHCPIEFIEQERKIMMPLYDKIHDSIHRLRLRNMGKSHPNSLPD